uniref:Glycoside hydrolase 35 catalytic domain-containing protein n=1 Tax=Acrobeloides nanus TaxID=290746 RepID=A0A914ED15_9BILA
MRVHPGLWNDRLQRIRALGFNAVQVYVPWNLHEPTEGNYLAKVQNYYNKLLDIVQPLLYKNGGPILTVQVENEYGYAGYCNHNYTAWLRDLIWSKLGKDVVLTTVDGGRQDALTCGTVPEVFATVDFGITSDSNIDNYFNEQHKFNNGGPTVCTEYWVNWFTSWGQTNGNSPNPASVVDNMNHMYYNWNASFNVYMVHGGTNFGFMNGAYSTSASPITTSYDYGAPIAENGDITPTYKAVRSWIQNISDWPQPPLDIPANNPASNYGQVTLQRIGANLISTLTQIQETCQQSQDPLNFEQLDHGYGYVLYTTTLIAGGKNLAAPNIHDYGYVFVNNVYQGLHTGVTLDGVALHNWYACGINLTKAAIDQLASSVINENNGDILPEKAASTPGVFVGQFVASALQDTFFDSRGWGKGQLFVNGYNLGRYWPTAGPQVTISMKLI